MRDAHHLTGNGRAAVEIGIPIREGVYLGNLGPVYETPAEVAMLRSLGADVVGMSTVLEVIAARHMGLRCACISLVSNPAAGVTDDLILGARIRLIYHSNLSLPLYLYLAICLSI